MDTHALLLTVFVVGEGEVMACPVGIDCGTTCSAEFEGSVTLTATAKAGLCVRGLDWLQEHLCDDVRSRCDCGD